MRTATRTDAHVIVPDGDQYRGRYVAMRSLQDNSVIASGRDAGRVIRAARRLGVESPVVLFVPKDDLVCVY